MTDAVIYEQLKANLQGLRNFIINNEMTLRSGLETMSTVVPQVRHLTANLVTVMEQFHATLEGVKEITLSDIELLMTFSGHLHSFLSGNPMLPTEPEHRADLVRNTQLMGGLNALAHMREELVQLTEDIIFQVRALRTEERATTPSWVN
jgi:predicted Zn-dependent protease with MMP-like domain